MPKGQDDSLMIAANTFLEKLQKSGWLGLWSIPRRSDNLSKVGYGFLTVKKEFRKHLIC